MKCLLTHHLARLLSSKLSRLLTLDLYQSKVLGPNQGVGLVQVAPGFVLATEVGRTDVSFGESSAGV